MKRSSSPSSSRPASRASSAPVNRLIVATVLLLAFAGAIGLGTVWLRHQISEVARTNKQMQARTAEVERRINESVAQIASATSPRALDALNASLQLGLIRPLEQQIFRVDATDEMLLANSNASAEQFRRLTVPTVQLPQPSLLAPSVLATVQR